MAVALKRSFSIGALVALGLASRAAAGERWVEVRSPHFQVVGDAGFRAARGTAQRLEKFRGAVAGLFPAGPDQAEVPTTVLVFKSAGSFAPLFPLYQGRRVTLGGLFISGLDRNYVALDTSAGDGAYATVLHEYTHLLTSRLGSRLPLWLNEGVAELYGTAQVRAREVIVGQPVPAHVRTLRERPLLPLETLFALGPASPEYNERDTQGIFYAQSWALAHYILIEQERRGHHLQPFLDALAAGATSAEACQRAFGLDLAALEKELGAYARRYSFPYRTAVIAPVERGQLVARTLGAHESAFHLGDALVHETRLQEARPFLERAIALRPDFAPAYRSMGLGHAMAGEHTAAMRWLGSAIERDPADGIARLLRARAALAAAGGSFGPGAAAIAREDARVAVRALPQSAEAWQLLAHIDSVLGRRDDEAVSTLREAVRLSPERADLWRRLVQVLLARRELDEARRVAELRRARASGPEERREAEALMAIVAAAGAGQGR